MRKLLTATFLLFTLILSAQDFSLGAEIRPRFENNHGAGTLLEPGADGNNFVSQRTRLNFNFAHDKIRLGISAQNVRVWGDVSTLSADDTNTALHTAWAEAILSDKISIIFGRQEIAYDDHRIFGSVGWAQQARSHDAMVTKFKLSEKSKLDIGLALNANTQSKVDETYDNVAGYKTFQYAWYHTDFDKLGLSILALNNGVEYADDNMDDKIAYSQTLGSRLTYKTGKLAADASFYFQTGKIEMNSVSASNFAINANYKATDQFLFGAGFEYFSGKDDNDFSSDVKSFNPLYGTNHKFNGWMDYFYVGNHGGSVGLVDINAVVSYSKDKFGAQLRPHFFSAAADVYDGLTKMDANLGTEIDLRLDYKLSPVIGFSAGHSMMFATESMEVIKNSTPGAKDENNSWTWIMVTFNPELFKHTAKK